MLSKARRLSNKAEFERVFKMGRVLDRPELRIIWARGHGRAAVVAAKSIGSIANRNRVRRRWREALRLCEGSIPGEIDLVMVIKPAGSKIPGSQALEVIREALRQLTI